MGKYEDMVLAGARFFMAGPLFNQSHSCEMPPLHLEIGFSR